MVLDNADIFMQLSYSKHDDKEFIDRNTVPLFNQLSDKTRTEIVIRNVSKDINNEIK